MTLHTINLRSTVVAFGALTLIACGDDDELDNPTVTVEDDGAGAAAAPGETAGSAAMAGDTAGDSSSDDSADNAGSGADMGTAGAGSRTNGFAGIGTEPNPTPNPEPTPVP